MLGFRAIAPLLLLAAAPAAGQTAQFVTDEAEAALAILDDVAAGRTPAEERWVALFGTEGFRRLRAREVAMGRSLTDSAMRAYLLSPGTVSRAGALRETLARWKAADLSGALERALRYLPSGTEIPVRIYLLIKPATNTFVFEASTNPAIMVYLDPEVSAAELENTMAHELHHIGNSRACRGGGGKVDGRPAEQVRFWMSAFGEGFAMLAAAGGPEIHPHATSKPAERTRWDRDIGKVAADFRELERFFLDVLDRRFTAADSIRSRAMSFFGLQGPWYTVGWTMARAVESARGHAALLEVICDPPALVRRYDEVARERGGLPLWDKAVLDAIH